jgi:AraC-like DNA-binding protein
VLAGIVGIWQPSNMALFMQIDLMARGASLALFALWIWILLRDHRDNLAARVAVAMNIAIAGYILATVEWNFDPSPIRFVLSVLAGSTPGLFWLFARIWFNDKQRLERWAVALITVAVVNIIIMQLTFESSAPVNFVAAAMFRLSMLGFAAAGLWEAWRGRENDLVEVRRKMRPRIVGAVGLYIILITVSEVAAYNYHAPIWIARGVGGSIAIITLIFFMVMFDMRQGDLFGVSKKAVVQNSVTPADNVLTAKLQTVMRHDLPHRDEGMTIARLAAQLGEQEYRLRRHINGTLGHRNFAAFLNSYRLAEVKGALADPDQKEVPIITIALDAGFGSLGPFNRAFREAEGMTPSEYRALRVG